MNRRPFKRAGAAAALALLALPALAATLAAPFATDYTAVDLGSVPGVPTRYGGLTFLDNDTLLIGGAANGPTGRLYTIDVVRGADLSITGFSGSANVYGSVGTYNDGGVTFGPGGVLFTSQWPVNRLGQTKPGSTVEDKVIDLAALGVAQSHAAIGFVPSGFAGAGEVKLVSWAGGQWYSASVVPDGSGTYNLSGLAQVDLNGAVAGIQNVPGGPEGFVYIDAANAGFGVDSMLISEYSANLVSAYEIDAAGNPLVATRRTFLSGLNGAEGAVIDPLTGDFLFSTFGGLNQVVRVSGFIAPTPVDPGGEVPAIPEPSTYALMLAGLGLVGLLTRRRTG
jgi:hypothetical protein